MKIFASLLLVFMLTRPIISYDSDEYADETEDTSTTSTTTEEILITSTESTTTTTPGPQINHEVTDFIEKVSTRFNELKSKFIKNQEEIYDKVQKDLEKYKTVRDTSIKIMKDAYDHEIASSNDQLKSIETQKTAIEKSIKDIQENTASKQEILRKIEKLKKRIKLLNEMKAVNCEDCDGFLDNDQIDTELKKTDNEIAHLDELLKKHESESENGTRKLNDDEISKLNTKYVELIQVYQKEVEERSKMEHLELINSIINDKWKNYAEKVGDLHVKAGVKLGNMTNNSLKIIRLTSNDSSSNDDWEFNDNPDKFKWIPFDKNTKVPTDAVSGGEDTDGSSLFIIRSKKDDSYLYGKFAVSDSRKDAYVTNSDVEIVSSSFELLTSKNYQWCDAKTYDISKNTLAVCKTTHYYEPSWSSTRKEIILPGTLLKDGKCRVGFAWKVHTYSENIKVLGFGSCDNAAGLADIKFWF